MPCQEQVPYYQSGLHPIEGGDYIHQAALYDEKKFEHYHLLGYPEEALG